MEQGKNKGDKFPYPLFGSTRITVQVPCREVSNRTLQGLYLWYFISIMVFQHSDVN
jgi:hypothetical protein